MDALPDPSRTTTPYHLLGRGDQHRWWRPLAEMGLFAVLFGGFVLAFLGSGLRTGGRTRNLQPRRRCVRRSGVRHRLRFRHRGGGAARRPAGRALGGPATTGHGVKVQALQANLDAAAETAPASNFPAA
jgi:hypothetical protein